MKIRPVNSFLADPTLTNHFSIYVNKHAIFIIHGERGLMCMKIKVLSEGSLRNMFFPVSAVPKKVSPEVPKKRTFRKERTSMI